MGEKTTTTSFSPSSTQQEHQLKMNDLVFIVSSPFLAGLIGDAKTSYFHMFIIIVVVVRKCWWSIFVSSLVMKRPRPIISTIAPAPYSSTIWGTCRLLCKILYFMLPYTYTSPQCKGKYCTFYVTIFNVLVNMQIKILHTIMIW